MENKNKKLSIFLSLLLRHKPETIGLHIEKYGAWADINELIEKINRNSQYKIDREVLEEIVREDEKQRYKSVMTAKKSGQVRDIPLTLSLKWR